MVFFFFFFWGGGGAIAVPVNHVIKTAACTRCSLYSHMFHGNWPNYLETYAFNQGV